MTNPTQLLEEASRRAYYDTNSESVELGFHRLKGWNLHSVLLLMVVAIILWMFSYALFMVIMFYYDKGNEPVVLFDISYWINETCVDDKKFANYVLNI